MLGLLLMLLLVQGLGLLDKSPEEVQVLEHIMKV